MDEARFTELAPNLSQFYTLEQFETVEPPKPIPVVPVVPSVTKQKVNALLLYLKNNPTMNHDVSKLASDFDLPQKETRIAYREFFAVVHELWSEENPE